jgi:hypothetical protein
MYFFQSHSGAGPLHMAGNQCNRGCEEEHREEEHREEEGSPWCIQVAFKQEAGQVFLNHCIFLHSLLSLLIISKQLDKTRQSYNGERQKEEMKWNRIENPRQEFPPKNSYRHTHTRKERKTAKLVSCMLSAQRKKNGKKRSRNKEKTEERVPDPGDEIV